jgi:hypothetical protein
MAADAFFMRFEKHVIPRTTKSMHPSHTTSQANKCSSKKKIRSKVVWIPARLGWNSSTLSVFLASYFEFKKQLDVPHVSSVTSWNTNCYAIWDVVVLMEDPRSYQYTIDKRKERRGVTKKVGGVVREEGADTVAG